MYTFTAEVLQYVPACPNIVQNHMIQTSLSLQQGRKPATDSSQSTFFHRPTVRVAAFIFRQLNGCVILNYLHQSTSRHNSQATSQPEHLPFRAKHRDGQFSQHIPNPIQCAMLCKPEAWFLRRCRPACRQRHPMCMSHVSTRNPREAPQGWPMESTHLVSDRAPVQRKPSLDLSSNLTTHMRTSPPRHRARLKTRLQPMIC